MPVWGSVLPASGGHKERDHFHLEYALTSKEELTEMDKPIMPVFLNRKNQKG